MTNTNATQARTYSGFTYGDTLELPGVPGILWRVQDVRDVDSMHDTRKARAELLPVDPAEPDSYYAGRRLTVKIGRAERHGVEISLYMDRDYDRATDTYGELKPAAYARTSGYDVTSLTDAQSATLRAAALSVNFYLPELTPAEILERVTKRATGAARNAAHDVWNAMPDRFNSHDGSSRRLVSAALTAEAREEIATACAAEFLEAVRKTLRSY